MKVLMVRIESSVITTPTDVEALAPGLKNMKKIGMKLYCIEDYAYVMVESCHVALSSQ